MTNDYITLMRGMYAGARIRFRELAAPHIDNAETAATADALAGAVGEVSPEDALEALIQWKQERSARDK
jgi:hypothetical protein